MSLVKELIEIYNNNKLLIKSESDFIEDAQPLIDKYIDDRVKLILNGVGVSDWIYKETDSGLLKKVDLKDNKCKVINLKNNVIIYTGYLKECNEFIKTNY